MKFRWDWHWVFCDWAYMKDQMRRCKRCGRTQKLVECHGGIAGDGDNYFRYIDID